MAIRDEQAAFEAMRDALINDPATAGKHVVIFGGQVVGFFDSLGIGYAEGLRRFGTQAEFLLSRVEKRPPPVCISASWEYGLVRVE